MIPNTIDIANRLDKPTMNYILLNPDNYFKLADEYVSLQKTFTRETIFEKIMLWVEMVISPIITIVISVLYKTSFDISGMFSIKKSAELWRDWFRMKQLKQKIQMWIKIVRSYGGPFISSNDAEYHVFVYADGMQRLYDSLRLLIAKKRTKRLQ